MLESLLSFLLGWTTAGQCHAGISSINRPGIINTVSAKGDELSGIPITHVYTVSENIVALQVNAGQLIRGGQVAYEAKPGDRVNKKRWVVRGGKKIGQLVSEKRESIWLADQYVGPKLNTDCVDRVKPYRLVATNGTTLRPTNVYRKSNIDSMAQTGPWSFEWPMEHVIYLELSDALTPGETYQINVGRNGLQDTKFVYHPEQTRSESVHVSHLGFAPNDPVKVAFLSTWMGTGGGLNYDEGKPFWLIDTATKKTVYKGQINLSQSAQAKDLRERNHNDTDVFIMDFSEFKRPGHYRVYVDGVGTSYEFAIGNHTWRDAFYVSARGMYHQRSGIALEPPYTDYKRPRSFHPDDGVVVYRSTVPLMDTNMGFRYDSDVDAFEALVSTRTDEVVDDAWGGWMDAGDWDRRIPHLEVSRSFLELVELYPDYFKSVNLNLPESSNELPDILDEALWGLDIFLRLQTKAGGIPGGIESAGHPIKPEGSWQESQQVMVYGPGIWSSFLYANVAARAAHVLKQYDPTLASTYQASAIRAMNWANIEFAQHPDKTHRVIETERNLAAAELYRLTGDQQWHQLFLDTTVFKESEAAVMDWPTYDQSQAAFVYARTNQPTVNKTVKQNALNALVRAANNDIQNIEQAGFKWNLNPRMRIGWGLIGTPRVDSLFHAHTLTKDDKYLKAGILATQFSAGANPSNMVYTTGLGYRNPDRPLIVDAIVSGQEPPPGITVYGPMDVQNPDGYVDDWYKILNMIADEVSPKPWEWPTSESYFDLPYYVPVTEFTVHQTMGPTAYAWGYLAARVGIQDSSIPKTTPPISTD